MRFLSRSLTGLFLLAVTLALLVLAGATVMGAMREFSGREAGGMPDRERVFVVNLVAVAPATVTPVLETFGEVRARRALEIRAQTGGPVVALGPGFEEGGRVEAGQLLLRIDPTNLEDALALARTDLAEAEAEQRDANAALGIAGDDLAAAERQAGLRAQALARQKDLATRGVGTEAAVETAALAEAAAQQAVLAKRSALASAEARLAQAANTLARRAIALAEAERRLAETELTAAFSGTLTDVKVVQGRVVTSNEQVATLIDAEALEVAFRVSTAQYARLLDPAGRLLQAPVTARIGVAAVDLVARGQIARESAEVGAGLTGRLLFARLDDARGFRPGDFVTVAVEEPPLEGVTLLPAAALDANGRVLVVGEGDRLEEAPVELMRRQGDAVLVRAPALAGREVVAEWAPVLGAGIKVRAARAGDAPTLGASVGTGGGGMGGLGGGMGGAPASGDGAMIALEPARRARLIAFVEANTRMPAEARARLLEELQAPEVAEATVTRLEARMGGG